MASWPIRVMPSPARRRCIAVPTPHSRDTGLSARNVEAPLRLSTAKPRGLSRSEASLARSLLSLNPIDTVMPSSASTRRASAARSWAGHAPRSFSVPESSRNASSIDNGSTSGVSRSIAAHRASYLAIFCHVRPDHDRIRAGGQRLEHRHRRAHTIEARYVAAGEHHTAGTTADDDGAFAEVGPVTLLDRSVKSVAIDMSYRQGVECGVADLAGRTAITAALAASRGSGKGAAIAAQRSHHPSPGRHSQAAPRTPLESPWTGGSRRLITRSEKMYCVHRTGT